MNNIDINALETKWQSQILLIGAGQFSDEQAKEILNNIIDEIVEHKEPIINGKLSIANNILLFTNIIGYGRHYGANIGKLIFLGL